MEADDEAGAAARPAELAERLLANPVIEETPSCEAPARGDEPAEVTARIGVVVFPGTNCEHDVVTAVEQLGGRAELVWHGAGDLAGVDAVVLPGGFAHGDYLRPGALARFSPVMTAVARFAADGGPVVGICNGFQVLTEAGLLPGALHRRTTGLRFLCMLRGHRHRVDSTASVLDGRACRSAPSCAVPINHFSGSYVCHPETLARLRGEDQVVLRYVENPNGSVDDIAGIRNEAGNVVGLMPNPERATSDLLGSSDGNACSWGPC